ncbi:MAG: nitroreductase [Lysobacteraceae bacterium]
MQSSSANASTDAVDFLLGRHSARSRELIAPGPDDQQLAMMLAAAVHVPDHGRMQPWRFIVVRGAARQLLGDALAARALERDPNIAQKSLEKERQRFSFAPLIIVVVAKLTPDHKIPQIEQVLSGGCACFSLLQAAQAMGFGAQWLTGWAAYDPQITALLGLVERESILGFIHIGSTQSPPEERERPDPQQLLSEWNGPQAAITNHGPASS